MSSAYFLQQDRCSHANGILQGPEEVWVGQLDHLQTIAALHVADPAVGLEGVGINTV